MTCPRCSNRRTPRQRDRDRADSDSNRARIATPCFSVSARTLIRAVRGEAVTLEMSHARETALRLARRPDTSPLSTQAYPSLAAKARTSSSVRSGSNREQKPRFHLEISSPISRRAGEKCAHIFRSRSRSNARVPRRVAHARCGVIRHSLAVKSGFPGGGGSMDKTRGPRRRCAGVERGGESTYPQ